MINLQDFEKKFYSQNGEDGITEKIIDVLYGDNKYYKVFVEFGVGNGQECNSLILRNNYNWTGLCMDAGYENSYLNLKREYITKNNIVSLFKKYNMPNNINLLSLDIDFNDFYILKELLKHYTFDILIIEYNATHMSNEDKIIIYNENQNWDFTNYFGASLLSFYKLCNFHNYSLVYCDNTGTNAFFIRNDIFPSMNEVFLNCNNIEVLYKSANYSAGPKGPNGGHPQDPQYREYITYDEAMLL
jgi:hypothetical protein